MIEMTSENAATSYGISPPFRNIMKVCMVNLMVLDSVQVERVAARSGGRGLSDLGFGMFHPV